jgi:ribosomal protein S18 acetylase RimI-like enzyme
MGRQLEIRPVSEESQLDEIRALAQVVWREHYPAIITWEQIEYMLDLMYSSEAMRRNWAEAGTTYDRALLGDELVGYCAYGRDLTAAEVKLYSLYVHADARRVEVGQRLVERVVDYARSSQARFVVLTVNKENAIAFAAYTRFGFTVREAVVTDIGGGFVMDDFVMELVVEPDA